MNTKHKVWTRLAASIGLALAALALLWLAPQLAHAATLEVCGTCTYTTIQAAIDAATPGDTIHVANGVFAENLVINKSVTLLGGYTALPGDTNTRTPRTSVISPAGRAISVTGIALNVVIDGFEIAHATVITGDGAGIYANVINDSAIVINDNYIHNNSANSGGGIYASADNRSSLSITDNDVMTNTADSDDGGGIWASVYLSGSLTIKNNQIVSNTASVDGGGMYAEVKNLSAFQVDDNTFDRNTADSYGGLYLLGDENVNGDFHRNIVRNNVTTDSEGGAYLHLDENTAIAFDDNLFQNNRANGGSSGGLRLELDSNSRAVGNRMIVDGNYANTNYGGANVDLNEGCAFTMTQGISVTNNVANSNTGGIYIRAMYSQASVPNMYIYNNRALNGSGGGFRFSYGDAGGMFYAPNAVVISNTAGSGNGGGGYVNIGDGSYADFSGSRFERNRATADGGGLYGTSIDEGTVLLLNNTIFLSNTAGSNGGGARIEVPEEFSWLEMNNTRILSNTAGSDGGGLYTNSSGNGSEFSFDYNTVMSNTAGSNGGGIYLNECYDGCVISVDDNVFANNHAGSRGGGYYQSDNFAESSTASFNRNQVISNTADSAGGGIYMDSTMAYEGGRVQFNDNLIAGNRSGGDGGGIRFDDLANSATAEFIGNTVINNQSEGDGGGIRIDDIAYYGSLVYFRDNVISGNVISGTNSDHTGGGVHIYGVGDGDTVWITGNTFNNNVAPGKGGGFFFDSDIDYASEMYFEGNELQYNQAQEGGGCYWDGDWEDGGPVTFRDNVVNNNTALGNYGGCYFDAIDEGTTAYISGNQFNDNTAGGDVGGVHIQRVYDGAALYFHDNEIIGNQAGISGTQVISGGNYGGLYLGRIYQGGEVQFHDNLIAGNTAYLTYTLGITPSGGSFGGLYVSLEEGGELVMDQNVIANNAAQDSYGGLSIEIQAARLVMDHNLITANTAITTGGGLHITGTLDGMYYLWHNQIVDNSAADQGGLALESDDGTLWGISENNLIAGNADGIHLINTGWRSINDTIADNGAYGILMTGTITSTAYVSNTILWGHSASFGKTQVVTYTDRFTMVADYSDVQYGWPGVGNLNVDPLFVGGGDYHLQAASPVINRADAAVAPGRDLDNIPRPVGAGVDMGAYEFHLSGVTVTGDGLLFGNPGTWVTHTVTITNDGDAEDEFDLSLSGNVWTSTLSMDHVILAAGADATVNVAVYVPAGASAGDSDTVLIVDAVSTRNAMVVGSADNVDTQANLVPDVSISPDNSAIANAGSTQIYRHVVENLGNGADMFNLSVASSQGWMVQIVPSSVTLGEGMTTTVQVRVTVPEGAGGLVDTTTLTATSASDGSVADSALNTTTAINNADLSLTPASRSASAGLDSSHTYTHTLTNNADITDTIGLTVTSSEGWSVSFSPASANLNPGASATVHVTVTTPATGNDGDVDLSTVVATSGNDTNVQASASDITILDIPPVVPPGVDVSLTPNNAATAMVWAVQTYTHTLTNNGTATDVLTPSVTSGQGWTVSVVPASVTLGVGQSAPVTVTVTLPGSGANGLVDITMVKIASANSGGSIAAAAADVTTLLNPASIQLTADQAITVTPDSTATYTHTLTNDGASVDTFSVAAVSDQGWTTQPSHNQITLQPGEHTDIILQVQVPASATEGTVDQTTLTVTSAYGADAYATNTDTTTVSAGVYAIYLPLVSRNY